MKDLVSKIFFGGSFTDFSIELNDYDVDFVPYNFTVDVDYFYVSLYKNFNRIFVSVKSQATPGSLSFEYYNGTAWVTLNVVDETKNFSRSGFITWNTILKEVEVDGNSAAAIRITGTAVGELNGINMLFANDNDLKGQYRSINEYLGSDLSFVALHQASRKDIVQRVRNAGNTKVVDGTLEDLTIWDFLEPTQLRLAATYLCLSKIFAGVSDNAEGKFMSLSKSFYKDYLSAVDTFLITTDKDDDGEKSTAEANTAISMTRIYDV